GGEATVDESAVQAEPVAPAGHSDQVVITARFAECPFPDFMAPIRRCAEEFERMHPRYRVVVHGHDYEQLPAAVDQATRAGDPPTIASFYSGATQQARDAVTRDGRPLFTTLERALARRTD